jgi:hypothetical protein
LLLIQTNAEASGLLLSPDRHHDRQNSETLKLRQPHGGEVYVEGLKEIPISNVRDGLSLIVAGEERRKVFTFHIIPERFEKAKGLGANLVVGTKHKGKRDTDNSTAGCSCINSLATLLTTYDLAGRCHELE